MLPSFRQTHGKELTKLVMWALNLTLFYMVRVMSSAFVYHIDDHSVTLYLFPVTIQLLVIESILVLRIWAIMGKRRWILWTFFGLLVCTTATSIAVNLSFLVVSVSMVYV